MAQWTTNFTSPTRRNVAGRAGLKQFGTLCYSLIHTFSPKLTVHNLTFKKYIAV